MSTSGTLDQRYFENLKNETMWGTYGRGGVEHCAGRCPEHQLKWKKLVDCDTDHLQAILRTQRQVDENPFIRSTIHAILIERGEKPKAFRVKAEREMYDKVYAAARNFPLHATINTGGTNADTTCQDG